MSDKMTKEQEKAILEIMYGEDCENEEISGEDEFNNE